MTHKKKYPLRATDFDKYQRIKPSCILELFQDVAGEHAESFGAGYLDMKNKGQMWVIIRTKYISILPIERYSTVEVETWPLKSRGLVFRREYQIRNEKGEICIKGSSDWAIVSAEKRSLVVNKNVYPFESMREDLAIDEKLTKLPLFTEYHNSHETSFGFSAIDQNHHVNNVQYVNAVFDGLGDFDKEIISFQIDYHKEILQDEKVTLYYNFNQKEINVKGNKNENDLSFQTRLVIK